MRDVLSACVTETGAIKLIFTLIRKDEAVDVTSDVKCE